MAREERRKKAEREPFVSLLSTGASSSTFPLTQRERHRQRGRKGKEAYVSLSTRASSSTFPLTQRERHRQTQTEGKER